MTDEYNDFVTLMNIYHIFYKKEHKLSSNSTIFDNKDEMNSFKDAMIDSEKKNYLNEYDEQKNIKYLKKYNMLYHAKINNEFKYTSSNIIYLISYLVGLKCNINEIEIEKEMI